MAKPDVYNRYKKGGGTRRPSLSSSKSGKKDVYSRYAAGGVSEPKKSSGGPSVFSRVMDILSRGNYAVAEAQRRGGNAPGQTEGVSHSRKGFGQFNTDALSGAWAGLSGKRKTTFQQLVPTYGVTKGTNNRLARGVEGFLLDVLSDPTNLIGTGVAKVPVKGAQALKGADKGADAIKAVESAATAAQAARVAGEAKAATEALKKARKPLQRGSTSTKLLQAMAQAEQVKKSASVTARIGPEQAKALELIEQMSKAPAPASITAPPVGKVWSGALPGKALGGGRRVGATGKVSVAAQNAAQPSLFDEGLDVGRADLPAPTRAPEPVPGPPKPIVDDTPGLAGLTDSGAPISRALELRIAGKGVLRSEGLYNAGSKVLRPVGDSALGQAASRTFRTAHGLLPEVHNLQRIFSGQGRQAVADQAEKVHKIFDGGDVAPGVNYPRVNKEGQRLIYQAIQKGVGDDGVHAVDLLPPELKVPAQFMQVELAKLNDLARRTDDNLLDIDVDVSPEAARNAKFEEIPQWKGAKNADGTPKAFDRAPQAFIAQYDRAVRKEYFERFTKEVEKRFPDKSPEMIGNIKKSREVFGVDGEVSAAWRHHVDAVQGHWKRWVTQYRPGFHIRNMLGDSFNAYLAGTNPIRFGDAGRVLAHTWGKKDGAAGAIKMGGKKFSAEEVEALYRRGGLETSFIETEVIGASRRKISHAITEGSQQREKYVRMATFIDSMDKALKRGVSVQKAVEKAAFRVRKYHFDYTDLTPAERKLRTFIPFYTYTRKELPLLLEHTLTNPGKIVAPMKAGSAVETMLGVEKDPDDPFPGIDGLVPEYLKDQQIIQKGNNEIFTPGLPTDMLGSMGPRSFVKTQAGNLAPWLKGPLELGTGKSFPLGYNLKKKDQSETEMILRYLGAYAPYGNLVRDSKSSISERLINIMTGAGYKTVRG